MSTAVEQKKHDFIKLKKAERYEEKNTIKTKIIKNHHPTTTKTTKSIIVYALPYSVPSQTSA